MQEEITVTERQLLESFLLENPELERLEKLLEEFNHFEAIGAVRQELRHSDFLAFLLDPNQNHGLGDLVAKRLLQQALKDAPDDTTLEEGANSNRRGASLTPLDIALLDLDDLQVRREWRHADRRRFRVPRSRRNRCRSIRVTDSQSDSRSIRALWIRVLSRAHCMWRPTVPPLPEWVSPSMGPS